MKNFWDKFGEMIGDSLIIAFGCILIFIFVTIEILGIYGVENNQWLRWFELIMGVPIIALGINRLIRDIRRRK